MSTYLNAYTPPTLTAPEVPFEAHLNTPPSAYDLNWSGGPIPNNLRTDRLALIPFIPSLHAKQYFHGVKDHPELVRFMPYPKRIDESLDNLLYVYETTIRRLPGACLWAIFDLTKVDDTSVQDVGSVCPLPPDHPPLHTFAGVMGLLNTDRAHLVSELGHILILPRAQKTHVTTHSIALLQHYVLDHPYMQTYSPTTRSFVASDTLGKPANPAPLVAPFEALDPPRSLGMRRLFWQAHYRNDPSTRLAQRMQFRPEGIARHQRVAPTGGEGGREGDGAGESRSSWIGAMTWRDWEDSGRDKVDLQLQR